MVGDEARVFGSLESTTIVDEDVQMSKASRTGSTTHSWMTGSEVSTISASPYTLLKHMLISSGQRTFDFIIAYDVSQNSLNASAAQIAMSSRPTNGEEMIDANVRRVLNSSGSSCIRARMCWYNVTIYS